MYELLGSYLCCVGQKVFMLELLDKQGTLRGLSLDFN